MLENLSNTLPVAAPSIHDLDEVLKLRAEGTADSQQTSAAKRARKPSRILFSCRISPDLCDPYAAVDTQQRGGELRIPSWLNASASCKLSCSAKALKAMAALLAAGEVPIVDCQVPVS